MNALLADLTFATRLLRKGGTVTLLTVLTLALGIGCNTAMFSFLNFVYFRPAPAGDPTRLAWIGAGPTREPFGPMSVPHFRQLQRGLPALSGAMGYAATQLSIGGGSAERAMALVVSGNYFDVMRVRPAPGRGFLPDEDEVTGAKAVAVISHAVWQQRFGAAADVVGKTVVLNGKPFVIVGVAPAGFFGMDTAEPIGVWVPLAMLPVIAPSQAGALTNPAEPYLRVVGRLRDGVPLEQLSAAAAVFATQLNADATRPEARITVTARRAIGTQAPGSRADTTRVFLLLAIVPAMVLLIACANAANIQLARDAVRRREIAVRLALGASRGRLVRQLLTESSVLAAVAGAVGTLVAYWLIRLIAGVAQLPPAFAASLRIDPQVLLATLALSLSSGVLFGLIPALSATRLDVRAALSDNGPTMVTGPRRVPLRSVLLIAQVGVSMVLLITAGLFVRSLDRVVNVDPGFRVQPLAATTIDLHPLGYTSAARTAFLTDALERVRGLPGVQAAAFTLTLPLSGSRMALPIVPEGATVRDDTPSMFYAAVTPGFFETMQLRLVRGRALSEQDTPASQPVAVVDERMAERLWPGQSALGKRLRIGSDTAALREVVGVTRTIRTGSLADPPEGLVLVPLPLSQPSEAPVSLVVRTAGSPGAMLGALRALFESMDANLSLQDLMTYEQLVARSADGQRAAASLLGILGGLALMLAGLGLYGVTSHGVTSRTREIGIRMSLGARRAQIQRMVVRESVRLTAIGVVLGVLLSLALARLIAAFLFGLAATDGVTFVVAAVVLCVVAAVASFVPARRAASVDPLIAMRSA
ncbi:MAG: ABC transporter permease [Gemmatimonadaceae bacterium]|nr:ABC transporter permease [Gemmatimonadaceae bacterium]